MIIELLLSPLWLLLDIIIGLLPSQTMTSAYSIMSTNSFFEILGKGISVIGGENFVLFIGSFLFWYTLQLTWAVIEWVYRKIPGVS